MSRSTRTGLSLIEVLVVLAIIAILIGFFTPATRRVGEGAARSTSTNNLKMIGLAAQNFHDTPRPPVPPEPEPPSPASSDRSPAWLGTAAAVGPAGASGAELGAFRIVDGESRSANRN